MTTFDKREEGFEKQFAVDEELKFKATARRNKMLGLWAAAKLELSGAEAEAYANRVVPEARGKAAAIIQEAEGYRLQTVAQATGQVSRFNQIYDQYKKAPEVTRERLYLETLERVLAGMDKIILDQSGGQGQGVVPYLPLGSLTPRAGEGDRK